MLFTVSVFFLAGTGIVALFGLKRWERAHARILFPEMRRKADEKALRIKGLLIAGTRDLEKLPPHILYTLRVGVHMGAIAFGHLAHWIGERSHDLADLVSHKHRFERQPPRSEFLKQVNEHTMRSSNGRTNGASSMRNRSPNEGNGFNGMRPIEPESSEQTTPKDNELPTGQAENSEEKLEKIVRDVPARIVTDPTNVHPSDLTERVHSSRRSRKRKAGTKTKNGEGKDEGVHTGGTSLDR